VASRRPARGTAQSRRRSAKRATGARPRLARGVRRGGRCPGRGGRAHRDRRHGAVSWPRRSWDCSSPACRRRYTSARSNSTTAHGEPLSVAKRRPPPAPTSARTAAGRPPLQRARFSPTPSVGLCHGFSPPACNNPTLDRGRRRRAIGYPAWPARRAWRCRRPTPRRRRGRRHGRVVWRYADRCVATGSAR